MEETGMSEPSMFVVKYHNRAALFSMYKTEISMQNVVHMTKKVQYSIYKVLNNPCGRIG